MNNPDDALRALEQLAVDGQSEELTAELELALSKFADHGPIWQLAGSLRHYWGDFRSAASAFEHASILVPLGAGCQLRLADCYAQMGQARHAHSLYSLMLEAVEQFAEFLPAIASGLGRIGDFDSAYEACRLAFERDPSRPEPLYGMVYYMRRQGYSVRLALPVIANAVELAPENTLYRVTYALMLAEDDRINEAYELLRDVSTNEIRCRCLTRRMMAVYQMAGDYARWQTCHDQLKSPRFSS